MKAKKKESLRMEKLTQKRKWTRVLIVIIVAIVLVLSICAGIYFALLNHNTDAHALDDTQLTKVSNSDNKIFLDGPGTKDVFVFYPGALCDSEAYCSLLKPISDSGTDVIIAKPPFHFQLLNINQIDTFMQEFQYESWSVGGHSLGGVTGAMYCKNHPDTYKNIVLVASYASEDIKQSCKRSLLLTASNDEVLNWDNYRDSMDNCPADRIEKCIEGGNHAQFANYGEQDGDGIATISAEEQQSSASKYIADFLQNN